MTRFVIIGAGEAGTRAALDLKGKGDVILIGDEPHWPYERPPLSKPGTDGVSLKPIATKEALSHVEFRRGARAVEIDRDHGIALAGQHPRVPAAGPTIVERPLRAAVDIKNARKRIA